MINRDYYTVVCVNGAVVCINKEQHTSCKKSNFGIPWRWPWDDLWEQHNFGEPGKLNTSTVLVIAVFYNEINDNDYHWYWWCYWITDNDNAVDFVWQKLNRRMHLSKVKHSKFNESGQLAIFYVASAAWGIDLIIRVCSICLHFHVFFTVIKYADELITLLSVVTDILLWSSSSCRWYNEI